MDLEIKEIDNKIKYLKNLIDIIIYDVDIRGNNLTFENTITTTEDILEYIRLKELKKYKLLIYNKNKKVNEINKYIDKLNMKDQYSINKLLLNNENIIYYNFLVKNDKEFINNNFDKNNCPKKSNKRKIRQFI